MAIFHLFAYLSSSASHNSLYLLYQLLFDPIYLFASSVNLFSRCVAQSYLGPEIYCIINWNFSLKAAYYEIFLPSNVGNSTGGELATLINADRVATSGSTALMGVGCRRLKLALVTLSSSSNLSMVICIEIIIILYVFLGSNFIISLRVMEEICF